MSNTTQTPRWQVVIQLRDEDGNLKLERTIHAERETKNHPYTTGVLPSGVPKYERPAALEWKGKELLKAIKADGTAARIDGKDAGFEVDFKIRFSNYDVQLRAKEFKPSDRVAKDVKGIEM